MNVESLKTYDPTLEIQFFLDKDKEIKGISHLEMPLPHTLIFIKDQKFFSKLGKRSSETKFPETGVILEKGFWSLLQEKNEGDQLNYLQQNFAFLATTQSVPYAMAMLSQPFYAQKIERLNSHIDGRQMGSVDIHPTAFIAQGVFLGENVRIGADVKIYPGSVLMGENEIKEGTVLYPNTTLYPGVKIGERCRIHSGTVIGADGFGYVFEKGIHHKIWHMGGVILEDEVEIGANSAVDGGTFSPTVVGKGTKIDNLVQVGHNCHIGKGVILCGHVAIGGSTTIGDFTVFGGKSAAGNDVVLGKGCQVAGGAMVNTSWPDGSTLGGHPARPFKEWMRGLAYLRKNSLRSST